MARFVHYCLFATTAGLSTAAHAGGLLSWFDWQDPYAKLFPRPSESSITAPVDVPLFAAPTGTNDVGVFAHIGEHRFFLQVRPELTNIRLTEAAASLAELKTKDVDVSGSDFTTADVEELRLGEAALQDVRVLVGCKQIDPIDQPERPCSDAPVDFDGTIGLTGLASEDGISWALLLDEGVLRLAPAEMGERLVSELEGTSLSVAYAPARRLRDGEDKRWFPPAGLLVSAAIGDAESPATALDWGVRRSSVDVTLATEDDSPTARAGDRVYRFQSAGFGDLSEHTWVQQTSGYSHNTTADGPLLPMTGTIGFDVLEEFSFAFDPLSKTLGIRRAEAPLRAPVLPELLADAQTALEESKKPSEDASGEDAKGDEGAWRRLALIQTEMGDLSAALASYEEIAGISPDSCQAHRDLGLAMQATGDLEGAREALTTGHKLFAAWWSDDIAVSPDVAKKHPDARALELANRRHIAALSRAEWSEVHKEQAGADGEESALPEGLSPQPGAPCQDLPARLAAVEALLGQSDSVTALYADRAEWDSTLPVVAGNQALSKGKLDEAAAAYRQAARMDLDPTAWARTGLAAVAAQQERWEDARALIGRATANGAQQDTLELWLLLRSEKNGPVGAAKDAAQIVNRLPDHAGAATLWAEWATAAGDEARASAAIERAKELTKAALLHNKNDADSIALNARLSLISGDLDRAMKGATRAVQLAPHHSQAHLTLSKVYAAMGDDDKATAEGARAAALATESPLYAYLTFKKAD